MTTPDEAAALAAEHDTPDTQPAPIAPEQAEPEPEQAVPDPSEPEQAEPEPGDDGASFIPPGQPDWLHRAFDDVHRRLLKLEGRGESGDGG